MPHMSQTRFDAKLYATSVESDLLATLSIAATLCLTLFATKLGINQTKQLVSFILARRPLLWTLASFTSRETTFDPTSKFGFSPGIFRARE